MPSKNGRVRADFAVSHKKGTITTGGRRESLRTKGGTDMSVSTKAILRGYVPFEKIEEFVIHAEGGAAMRIERRDESCKSASLLFKDRNGNERWAHVYYVKEPSDSVSDEIRRQTDGEGVTTVSLGHDPESERVLKALTGRFGGWFKRVDYDEKYEMILKKDPTARERFRESAAVWNSAAEKFAAAAAEFADATKDLDPAVLGTAEAAGFDEDDARGIAKRLAEAAKAIDGKKNA